MDHPWHQLLERAPGSLSDAERIALIAILEFSTSSYSGETFEGIYDTLLAAYHRWQQQNEEPMDPKAIEEIAALIVAGGQLAFQLFVKLEPHLNIGPDEKQNIANAIAASNSADQETIDRAAQWLAAHPPETNPAA